MEKIKECSFDFQIKNFNLKNSKINSLIKIKTPINNKE